MLLGKALTDEESDALELTIPVTPYGVKMTEMRGGSLAGGSTQTDAELTIPADAEAGSGSVEISASASPAGAIFEALEYDVVLRLHGADDVELLTERDRLAGGEVAQPENQHRSEATGREGPRWDGPPLRLPTRGRRMGPGGNPTRAILS
ncbi:MAG: hypothetical protein U0Q16_14185 [Bryobacteraceae bacterium]